MDPLPIVLPPGMPLAPEDDPYGPYVALSRQQWSELAEAVPWDLDAVTLARLRGLGDRLWERTSIEPAMPMGGGGMGGMGGMDF